MTLLALAPRARPRHTRLSVSCVGEEEGFAALKKRSRFSAIISVQKNLERIALSLAVPPELPSTPTKHPKPERCLLSRAVAIPVLLFFVLADHRVE